MGVLDGQRAAALRQIDRGAPGVMAPAPVYVANAVATENSGMLSLQQNEKLQKVIEKLSAVFYNLFRK